MIEETLCELIIKEYYESVYNLCYASLNRNHQTAEDCTQETFLIFFSKRSKLDYTDRIRYWLYKTAKKVIKSYIRKNKQLFVDINEMSDNGYAYTVEKESVSNEEIFKIFENEKP